MSDKSVIINTTVMAVIGGAAMVSAVALLPDEDAVADARDRIGVSYAHLDFTGFDFFSSPRPAPDISFSDAAGNSLDFDSFDDKILLVNLWATWCPPCIREMPSLDRLQAELGGESFEVVTLSVDEGGLEQVEPFFEDLELADLSIYLDPESQSTRAFDTRGLPTTVLIDRTGRWIATYEGAMDWDAPNVIDLMEQVIEL